MLPEPPPYKGIEAKDWLALFLGKLAASGASHECVQSKKELYQALKRFCQGKEKPTLDPPAASLLDRPADPLSPSHSVRVTLAYRAVAETGTLVFISGRDNPNGSHFLPDIEIALLRRSSLRPSLEDILSEIERPLPRGLYCVTGPSRSADIEQTLLMGAHGPRILHVIVFEDEA